MNAVIRELANELEESVQFGKLNVDQQPLISKALKVQTIPTFILFVNGKELARFFGAQPKSSLRNQIKRKIQTTPE